MVEESPQSDLHTHRKPMGWRIGLAAGVTIPLCIAIVFSALPRFGSGLPPHASASKMNLRCLAVGVLGYGMSKDGMLPPGGTFTDDGEPRHSWQTAILPYVEAKQLYEEVNLELPWNDPGQADVNKSLIQIYCNPMLQGPEFVNGFGVSHYAANERMLRRNESLHIDDVTDGTSTTIMLGEVGGGFRAWGDPRNVRDPVSGIGTGSDQFGLPNRDDAAFVFADLHAKRINKAIDPAVLRALATPAGGEADHDF